MKLPIVQFLSTLALGLIPPAFALGKGKICLFNAPTGASIEVLNHDIADFGHTGWGYLVGGTSTWVFGATEEPNITWHTTGSWSQMLAAFAGASHGHAANYYLYYKCTDTDTSAVGAANKEVSKLEAETYDWYGNNCLTRSIAIFQAYDSAITYHNPAGTGPNWYFDNIGWLDSHGGAWSDRQNLPKP
jgi:hypothetical protein